MISWQRRRRLTLPPRISGISDSSILADSCTDAVFDELGGLSDERHRDGLAYQRRPVGTIVVNCGFVALVVDSRSRKATGPFEIEDVVPWEEPIFE